MGAELDSQLRLFGEYFPNLRHGVQMHLKLHVIQISDFGVDSGEHMGIASAHASLELPQFQFTAADTIISIRRFHSLKWF